MEDLILAIRNKPKVSYIEAIEKKYAEPPKKKKVDKDPPKKKTGKRQKL